MLRTFSTVFALLCVVWTLLGLVPACAIQLPASPPGTSEALNEQQTVMVIAPAMARVDDSEGVTARYALVSARCTAVVVAPHTVVTASHCILADAPLTSIVGAVVTRSSWEHNTPLMPAKLVAVDPDNDIALLQVNEILDSVARLSGTVPHSGDRVHGTYHDLSRDPWRTTSGSFVDDIFRGDTHIYRSNIKVAKGASGGGLFNDSGELVGVALSISPEFTNFAAVDRVRALMQRAGLAVL